MARFNWRRMEKKWQKKWAWAKVHETDPKPHRPKYFVTTAYPYPNSPQHIGHGRTYTLTDVNARYHRMRGFNTLFPMGFHYTGTPILAMAKRLSANDPDIAGTFTDIYGVPQSRLEQLKDPFNMASYFHQEIKEGMVEIGYSVDWRREFTTIDPIYTQYIQWHFRKLKAKGLITRGTHPVGWCPNDQGPVGQHDTQGDVEAELGEFFLVKFEKDGVYYPTATLRPETIFGVTNLWVKPQSTYVRARVDNESWVISLEAAGKLRHQNHTVDIVEEINSKDLLWTNVYNPANKNLVPILPGEFVQTGNGTGVVMSVPGHAPYDYQALTDLKSLPDLNQESRRIESIQPISIINLEGTSHFPAADMVGKFRIRDQSDPRLEEATKELYSLEFHRGVMAHNTGPYAGMPVAKAREAIVTDFSRAGSLTRMLEIINRPVICRCGTECVVHILADQWFINYADPGWKTLARESLGRMTLFPDESRSEFNHAVEWLKEKACARKVGLGTRLPWDKDWVIESLSDSVVYMAYYILSKFISKEWKAFKKFEKEPAKLPDSFFDYIFLGQGEAELVSRMTQIPRRIIEKIRREFAYFYPVDMRHSGRDLVPNHLTFYIFHHAVLFPQRLWPKGIVANGFVLMDGTKMSKSLKNIIPLRQGIAKFGADPVRIGVLATAELGQDTDFSESIVVSIQERLVNLVAQARKTRRRASKSKAYSSIDRWMLNRLNGAVGAATESMEKLRVREAINYALYQLDNDLAWYQRRLGAKKHRNDNRDAVLRRVLEARAKILAPIAPHVAEEVWSLLGNKGLIVRAHWPKVDERFRDPKAERDEALVRAVLADTSEILKATGLKAKRVVFYSAADWKWRVFLKALRAFESGNNQDGIVRDIMGDPEIRKLGKQAADYANKVVQQARQMPGDMRKVRLESGIVWERKIITEALDFLSKELSAKVEVTGEDEPGLYDPKGRAKLAEPYRPAILVE